MNRVLVWKTNNINPYHFTIHTQHSLFHSFLHTGIAEPARGRGNSCANLPYFRFINAVLLAILLALVSQRITDMTFLSVPLITLNDDVR